jgi:hypothetical protein
MYQISFFFHQPLSMGNGQAFEKYNTYIVDKIYTSILNLSTTQCNSGSNSQWKWDPYNPWINIVNVKVKPFQVPHCNYFWLRFVTAKSSNNVAGFRKLQKSGFNRLFMILLVTVSFYNTKNGHNVTVINVTNCDFAKSGHKMKMFIESFKSC